MENISEKIQNYLIKINEDTTIKTKLLNDKKTEVLAKDSKYGLMAVTYTNRTQAYKKKNELGDGWDVIQRGRPFYIMKIK